MEKVVHASRNPATLFFILLVSTTCRPGISTTPTIPCWQKKEIDYYINHEAGPQSEKYIRLTFDRFSEKSGYTFRYVGRHTPGLNQDGKNTVSFMQAWPAGIPMTNIGYTQRWYDKTGIVEADIVLNQQSVGFTTMDAKAPGKYFLEGVLAHEIGHLLGLEHSTKRGDLMYHFQKPEETAIALDEKLFRALRLPGCDGYENATR